MKGLAHAGAPASAGAGRRPARSRLVPLLFLAAAAVPLGGAAGCTASSDSAADRAAAADTTAAADTLMLDALADTLAPAEAARYAFHGRDLEGKDGPLANIGYDLAHLYFAYRAHRRAAAAEGGTSFQPPGGGMTVTEAGKVTVDATAAESGEQLRADLDALGLDGGATAGPVVSGRLPIEVLPEAAALESLRALRPSVAMTQ
jgi:hypothetical protein